jgi:hypothetical protein
MKDNVRHHIGTLKFSVNMPTLLEIILLDQMIMLSEMEL